MPGAQIVYGAVLQHMFDAAKENVETVGDGGDQILLEEERPDLPACRNDHDLEFIARVCG